MKEKERIKNDFEIILLMLQMKWSKWSVVHWLLNTGVNFENDENAEEK